VAHRNDHIFAYAEIGDGCIIIEYGVRIALGVLGDARNFVKSLIQPAIAKRKGLMTGELQLVLLIIEKASGHFLSTGLDMNADIVVECRLVWRQCLTGGNRQYAAAK
jgi:hypothetical protein